MKVNQISAILNTVFSEVLGEQAFSEDLGNIVSTGQIITGSTTFGDNFDNYAKAIVDKVGRTVFVDRTYTAQDLGIWRDSFEYGCVLEKIRVEVGKLEDNSEWILTDEDSDGVPEYNDSLSTHIEALFRFYPAQVRARYFNLKTTFRVPISITQKQLRGAFNSASDMARFIGMIENRIRTKLEIEKDQLQRRTLANLIAHKIAEGKVVDLSTLYASETGNTAPATLKIALQTPDFLRWSAKKITLDRELMTQPSQVYSDLTGDFFNFTPEGESRMIVLSDYAKALAFNLYSSTFNEEFVKLDGFKKIPFWQATGPSMDITDRSALNVITTAGEAVNCSGVLGITFDSTAAMICNEEPDVRSQYNADGNFTNFLYCVDCSFYNDFDENVIVYVYGGADDNGLRATFAQGTNSGETKATVSGKNDGTTLLYKVATTPVSTQIGDPLANGTDDWHTLTSGSTSFATTTDSYTYIASVKSGKCEQLVCYHVPAAKIKT